MRIISTVVVLAVLVCFIPLLAFSEDVNVPSTLWAKGVITQALGESKEMASSWDEDGAPNFPYKAYDGDMETKWCTQNEEISWLKIDLVELRTVKKFVVYMSGNTHHGGDFGNWGYNFKDFQIQSSVTGKDDSWMDEVVVEGNPPDKEHGILTFEITPKATRWIRIYITNQGQDKHARLPEFQAWGSLAALAVSPHDRLATIWADIKVR